MLSFYFYVFIAHKRLQSIHVTIIAYQINLEPWQLTTMLYFLNDVYKSLNVPQ